MIAGLMQDERRDSVSGLPALSKVPFVGSLFGTREKEKTKSELIIFLIPQLLSGENQPKPDEKKGKNE
jgi:type II secretory pathway component GspD/PulD (secretin)